MKAVCVVYLIAVLCSFGYAQSQLNSTIPNATTADVHLNVPKLEVDLIQLIVDKLNVSLDLDLKVGNLVTLTAGVNAYIDKVNLTISGVRAQAELVVRLDNVAKIVEDTLRTISEHPEILTGLVDAIGGLLNDVAGILTQTINELGQVVQTVVDSAGNIINRTLDSTGKTIQQTLLGNINALSIITSATNELGQYITRVRSSDGSIYDITFDKPGGKILMVTIVSGPTSTSTTSSSTSTTSSPTSSTTSSTTSTSAPSSTTDATTESS